MPSLLHKRLRQRQAQKLSASSRSGSVRILSDSQQRARNSQLKAIVASLIYSPAKGKFSVGLDMELRYFVRSIYCTGDFPKRFRYIESAHAKLHGVQLNWNSTYGISPNVCAAYNLSVCVYCMKLSKGYSDRLFIPCCQECVPKVKALGNGEYIRMWHTSYHINGVLAQYVNTLGQEVVEDEICLASTIRS